jgi:hypothetical protein
MYNEYIDYLTSHLTDITELPFKSSDKYCGILEHVSYDYGKQYLILIEKEFPSIPLEQIVNFVTINDAIGSPTKQLFVATSNITFSCSPTSLRYVYHALIILQHFKDTHCSSIVEVGCGYGGLCLAIQYFSTIQSISIDTYTIIDLQPVCHLIETYLQYNSKYITSKIAYHSAYTYGRNIQDTNLFFISNYCYTEIEEHHHRFYTQILFPKISHGFITWQNGGNKGTYPITKASEIIGKPILTIMEEKPQTDAGYGIYKNYFTYF